MSTMTAPTSTSNIPPAGWGITSFSGRPTFVQVGGDCLISRPPALEGFEPYFVARHGTDFVKWTYKAKAASK